MRPVNVLWTAFVLLAALTSACSRQAAEPKTIDIATTTSVVNSGLMDVLLPLFEKETGLTVRVHAAGSGRALAMLEDGTVDLVISHAPQAESRMLAAHPDWRYQKFATNRFVVVGPPSDPAHVREARDVVDAFARVAKSRSYFLSRGDDSGTHEREKELWAAAETTPESSRLLTSGAGMGATLRQADAQSAYTLSDDATFMQLRKDLALEPLLSSGPLLVNSYAVLFRTVSRPAQRFAAWLGEGVGRKAIAAYTIGGTRPFEVWPAGCPGSHPTAVPCEVNQP
jgi:tungstate transport system substrate-binding protein